ncbi:MAG: T9SS type A sorting domain-containing protein [Saprospiraceae bacterium]|nr:T9SS type A sorting domain-containing protein [Saprospiraceae bacterium]
MEKNIKQIRHSHSGTNLGSENYAVYSGIGNSCTVSNLKPNTKYYFKIFEYNKTIATGNHALYKLCDAPTIAIQTLTSIIDHSASEVQIYPNPSSQNIKIMTTQKFNHTSVSIINQTGTVIEKIDSKNIKDSSIEISDYKSGLYFMQLQDSVGNKITKKIIKIEP